MTDTPNTTTSDPDTPAGDAPARDDSGDQPATDTDTTAKPDPDATGADERDRAADEALGEVRAEAAKYRTRLRDAEADRDAIGERLAEAQRREVSRQVGDRMHDPDDLWMAGTDVADMLDDDGNIDPERVTLALDELKDARPHWFTTKVGPPPSGRPAAMLRGGNDPTSPAKTSPSWSDALSRNG